MRREATKPLHAAGAGRASLVVAGAAASGQLVALLLTPVLTRLYEPRAFGALAAALAVVSIGIAVASLRYDYAIPVAASEEAADALLVLSAGLAAVVALVTGTAWAAAAGPLESMLGQPVGALAPLVATSVLVGGIVQAVTMWTVRRRHYGTVAAGRFGQTAAVSVAQLGLGAVGAGTAGLVVGDAIGRIAGALLPLTATLRALRLPPSNAVASAARAHGGLAGTLAVASLLNAAAFNAPFLLLPIGFGAVGSGMYFLAYRVLTLPAGLVGSAVGQVLLGDAASARRERADLAGLVLPIAVALLAVGLPACTAVAIAGPELFDAAFGSEWREAGEIARLLSPAILAWTVASPLSGLLVVARRERESLAVTAVELLVRLAAIGFGIAVGSLLLAVALLAVGGLVLNVAAAGRFLRAGGVGARHLTHPAAALVAINLPGAAAVLLASRTSGGLALLLGVLLTLALTVGASIALLPELRRLVSTKEAR